MDLNAEQIIVKRSGLLTLTLIHTIFSIVLIRRILVPPVWELWMIPVLALGAILQWVLRARKIFSLQTAMNIVVYHTLFCLFYYGIHEEVFTHEFPMAMMFFIMASSIADNRRVIIADFLVYAAVFLYHFTLTDGVIHAWEHNSRAMFVQVFLILAAIPYARYIIRHKRAENELTTKTLSSMEAMNRSRDDFMAQLSHELRTPTGIITGMIAQLSTEKLPPQAMERINAINDAGWHLSRHVNYLLEYSEIQAGNLVCVTGKYDFSSFVTEVMNFAFEMSRGSNLKMLFDIDPDIPSLLEGDRQHLISAARHIMDNAVKFTPTGAVLTSIRQRQESYGTNISFIVQDTGPGMTNEQILCTYQGRMFGSESQETAHRSGLGIGLPLARGLIRTMDGMLHITTAETGTGTAVTLCVPQKVLNPAPWVPRLKTENLSFLYFHGQTSVAHQGLQAFRNIVVQGIEKYYGIPTTTTMDIDDLPMLAVRNRATHLFLLADDFERNRKRIEAADQNMQIIALLPWGTKHRDEGRVHFISEPLTPLMLVRLLNSDGETENHSATRRFAMRDVRALVVDDNPLNLDVACGILRMFDIHAEPALGAREALERCSNQTWDIIFLDYMMPEMDGLEMFAALRADKAAPNANTPVVALTANAAAETRKKFTDAGFAGFLTKPIDIQQLEKTLQNTLPQKVCYHHHHTQALASPAPADMPMDPPPPEPLPLPLSLAPAKEPDRLELMRTFGFDTEAGIRNLGGSKDFYAQMTDSFVGESENAALGLEEALASGDIENYTIQVHALKSNLRMIGLGVAGEKAAALEAAGKRGDKAFIQENHPGMIEDLAAIRGFLSGLPRPEGGKTS